MLCIKQNKMVVVVVVVIVKKKQYDMGFSYHFDKPTDSQPERNVNYPFAF